MQKPRRLHWLAQAGSATLLVLLLSASGCGANATSAASAPKAAGNAATTTAAPATAPGDPAAAAYTPQTRDFVVTTVPLQVHEMQDMLPFLKKDFAKGGLLDGKEVYAFYPSTLVVYQGDKVDLTLVNPEDDAHTFTLPDLNVNVNLAGQSTAKTEFTAAQVGVHSFFCAMAEHAPYMWGQLVVLPDSAAS